MVSTVQFLAYYPFDASHQRFLNNTNIRPVYFCCPETRGHSLEQIDLLFISDSLKETDLAQTLAHNRPVTGDIETTAKAQSTNASEEIPPAYNGPDANGSPSTEKGSL